MLPEPLHPALVHFPIVFGALLPIVAIVSVVLIRRGSAVKKSWVWAVVLSAGLSGSAWLATETGEDQEEVVERVVSEAVIHDHEEAAEVFLRLSVLGLLVFGAGLTSGRTGTIARHAAIVVALVLVGAGYRVGESGGDLVYKHGAAQAYAGSADNLDMAVGREHSEPDEEEDDHR